MSSTADQLDLGVGITDLDFDENQQERRCWRLPIAVNLIKLMFFPIGLRGVNFLFLLLSCTVISGLPNSKL